MRALPAAHAACGRGSTVALRAFACRAFPHHRPADLDASVERVRQRLSKRSLGGSLSADARRDGDFSSQEYHDEDSRGRGKGCVARAPPHGGTWFGHATDW